jgi:hypothetical protein
MSFREKSAWISLISILAVFGYYFAQVGRELSAVGPLPPPAFLGQYLAAVILLVIVQIVLNIVAAVGTRLSGGDMNTARDEREKLIELKANRFALYIMQAGALTAAGAIALGAPGFLTANGLVLALALGELVRFGGQVLYYRLGV